MISHQKPAVGPMERHALQQVRTAGHTEFLYDLYVRTKGTDQDFAPHRGQFRPHNLLSEFSHNLSSLSCADFHTRIL